MAYDGSRTPGEKKNRVAYNDDWPNGLTDGRAGGGRASERAVLSMAVGGGGGGDDEDGSSVNENTHDHKPRWYVPYYYRATVANFDGTRLRSIRFFISLSPSLFVIVKKKKNCSI